VHNTSKEELWVDQTYTHYNTLLYIFIIPNHTMKIWYATWDKAECGPQESIQI
jgi:hypothetical protein